MLVEEKGEQLESGYSCSATKRIILVLTIVYNNCFVVRVNQLKIHVKMKVMWIQPYMSIFLVTGDGAYLITVHYSGAYDIEIFSLFWYFRGRRDEAVQSLAKLRGLPEHSQGVEEEIR